MLLSHVDGDLPGASAPLDWCVSTFVACCSSNTWLSFSTRTGGRNTYHAAAHEGVEATGRLREYHKCIMPVYTHSNDEQSHVLSVSRIRDRLSMHFVIPHSPQSPANAPFVKQVSKENVAGAPPSFFRILEMHSICRRQENTHAYFSNPAPFKLHSRTIIALRFYTYRLYGSKNPETAVLVAGYHIPWVFHVIYHLKLDHQHCTRLRPFRNSELGLGARTR
jgi:hypothetical protein